MRYEAVRSMNLRQGSLDEFTRELQQTILDESLQQYGPVVVDHWMNPRRWGALPKAEGYARYRGPCGDTMQIWLRIGNERIEDASFMTDGCGTSIACGSAVTDMVRGKTLDQASRINQQALLTLLGGLPEEDQHCALLAVTTLSRAIEAYRTPGQR